MSETEKKIYSFNRKGGKYHYWFEPKPSEELAYILGVALGDGTIKIDESKYRYHLRLSVVSEAFALQFYEAAKILGFGLMKRIDKNNLQHPMYSVYVYGKPFIYWCREMRDDIDKVDNFLKADNEIKAFIKGFYESEGSYRDRAGKNKNEVQIRIFNTRPEILFLIYKWLSNFGYKLSLHSEKPHKDNCKLMHILSLYGKQAERFISDINPCTKIKSRKGTGYFSQHPEFWIKKLRIIGGKNVIWK